MRTGVCRRSKVCSTVFSLALLPIFTPIVGATESLTVEEGARRAQRIVVATVLRTDVRPGPGGNLFTYTDFRVDETIKGDLRGNFPARVIGGKLGNVEISPAFVKPFAAGHRYVLFLGLTNVDGFVTVLPNLLFEVLETSDRQAAAIQGPFELPLFQKRTGKPYPSRPTMVPLEDFAHSLRLLTASFR